MSGCRSRRRTRRLPRGISSSACSPRPAAIAAGANRDNAGCRAAGGDCRHHPQPARGARQARRPQRCRRRARERARRMAGVGGLGRLFRRGARRRDRRRRLAAPAGFGAEAVHLRARLRGGGDPGHRARRHSVAVSRPPKRACSTARETTTAATAGRCWRGAPSPAPRTSRRWRSPRSSVCPACSASCCAPASRRSTATRRTTVSGSRSATPRSGWTSSSQATPRSRAAASGSSRRGGGIAGRRSRAPSAGVGADGLLDRRHSLGP